MKSLRRSRSLRHSLCTVGRRADPGVSTYAPRELRRLGATNWTLTAISFASSQAAPTGVSATATGGTGTTYRYVVTSVGELGTDESVQSSEATCNGNLFNTGAYNTVTWSAVAGASRRTNVYKFSGGLFGYVGQSTTTTFKDDNIAADMSGSPIPQSLFASTGNYPGAVSYFEQRRCFAGTINQPQNVWLTKSGTESQHELLAADSRRRQHSVPRRGARGEHDPAYRASDQHAVADQRRRMEDQLVECRRTDAKQHRRLAAVVHRRQQRRAGHR